MAIGFGAFVTPSRIRMPSPPQNSTTFMSPVPLQTACSDDFECGDREDQAPAPRMDVCQLRADLLAQVPRQDEYVVGLRFRDLPWRVDGDVRAGQEHALLVRRPVHGVGEQVRPDAAVVKQRVALAGGAV